MAKTKGSKSGRCIEAAGKKHCAKHGFIPPTQAKSGKLYTRPGGQKNKPSTRNYGKKRCACTTRTKIGAHLRCPTGTATAQYREGKKYIIVQCKGGARPYYVPGYTRCKPSKSRWGGCPGSKPR